MHVQVLHEQRMHNLGWSSVGLWLSAVVFRSHCCTPIVSYHSLEGCILAALLAKAMHN
jgi:hypothetical protein